MQGDSPARTGRDRLRGAGAGGPRAGQAPRFRRLEVGVAHLLEDGYVVGPDVLERVQEITRRETKTVPASARAFEDTGRFTVLGDVYDSSDRIAAGAFDQGVKRWQDSGERIPLNWIETPSSRHPIGSVDPATLQVVGGWGLRFEATVDLEGDHREKALDLLTAIKGNAAELGFAYALLAADEADGVRTLQDVDITGLTLKATPEGRTAIREERTARDRDLKRQCQEIQLQTLLGHDL